MTREEQLKYCTVCANRAVGPEHETICKLTKAKADFDPTCPNYAFDENVFENKGSSAGRVGGGKILLSILIAVFFLGRTLYKCNQRSERNAHTSGVSDQQLDEMIRNLNSEQHDQTRSLDKEMRDELGLVLMEKDTVISIDNYIDFTVPKDHYIMNNITDNEVKIVIRDTRNYMTFVHRFKKSDHPEEDWKKYRSNAGNQVIETTVSYTKEDAVTFNYEIKNALMTTHGRARIYCDSKYCYIFQCEHPGNTADKVRDQFQRMEKKCIELKK